MVHIESPKNNISWSGCIGQSNKNEKTKLDIDQPAMIASSMKPYVAATMLRLEEEKKLTIDDPIKDYLTDRTIKLFEDDGYNLKEIKIKHILAHRSGVYNYVNSEYFNMIHNDKKHRWTRDEQLQLSILMGEPIGVPADTFVYADANYLLATEIIETVSNLPFYKAMRDLLNYEELGLDNTWIPTLENPNPATKSLVHQYWSLREWDSYDIDPSFDLYGGGGIASTTKDLAQFAYKLFQGEIIEDINVLNKIYTKVTSDGEPEGRYCLGLFEGTTNGYKYYGHWGFWGSLVVYIPKLETSIAVFVLEYDEKQLRFDIRDALVSQLSKQVKNGI
jgi:D-alanyl-D-alanine carboxypeptidase